MKIVTAAEMREIDRLTTERCGVPSLTLMENAGTAVAEFAQKHFDFTSVCVVCGKGNNGGDGFVAARKLKEAGKQVSVIILAQSANDLRGDAAEMFKRLKFKALWVSKEADFNADAVLKSLQTGVVVDAILGTGFKPPLKGIAAKAIAVINALSSPVLAVDLPSGYDADEWWNSDGHCKADAVVTFTAPKQAHVFAPMTRGPMVVAPIGTPDEAVQSSLGLEWAGSSRKWFTIDRFLDANKGEFGHVFVVGGSVGKAGAPSMTSSAALKVGAGLVTAWVPASILNTVAQFALEVMTGGLDETSEGTIAANAVNPLAAQKNRQRFVMAVGPGISTNKETVTYIKRLVAGCDVPMILDADGLNAFDGCADLLDGSKRPLVLTPHPGEMSRLTGLSIKEVVGNALKVARDFAARHHVHLVLKLWRTIIADPDGRVRVSTTGNPGLAKGGSGDVLTGLIAGVVAQGRAVNANIGDAACAAVDLHGLSADIAVSEGDERTLMANDVIRYLPRAIRFLRRPQKFEWLRGFPKGI
jgi:NAD(P)H-hydrate epimerase